MPKHIILTDTSLDLADVIIVPRGALPQAIVGLAAGDYTIRNTSPPVAGVVMPPVGPGVTPIVTAVPSLSPSGGLRVGDSATLNFGGATGTPTPTRSWTLTRDSVDVSSEVVGNQIIFAQAGSYRLSVIWTNSAGQVTSHSSVYTVAAAPPIGTAPVITAQPSFSRVSAVVGQATTLNFGAASGNPTPTRTWRLLRGAVDVTSQVTGDQIIFATTGTYTLEVTWTNSAGFVVSNAVSITVSAAPAWQVAAGGNNQIIITSVPAPAAMVLTGGNNEIVIRG